MGLEGKDLVKRDLKRKVKGLVIPHKIDFSNKKIKRWKGPEKNDEDLVKKKHEKKKKQGPWRQMEKKWRAENSWEGEVKRKSWRYDYFSSRAGKWKISSSNYKSIQFCKRCQSYVCILKQSPCNNIICSELKVRIWKVVLDVILLQKWSSSLIGSA